jgi:hypothetical protein
MDFWCHASALLARCVGRACNSDLIKRRMLVARCGSSCAHGRERTAVSQSTQRDTVASSICVSICVVTRVVLVHRLLESAR